MSVAAVPLGELMPPQKQTVDPRKSPDEEFELFSIPAFDEGAPEVISGKDIGSSKQILERGDVLLSKIVPHIRRAWVVEPASDRTTIGSSEWIIFRSDRFEPAYLRHALVSDRFHQAFMQTVAGVGGSLLRARPQYVAEIGIPLPSVEQQRRIAAVLDAAESLRAKRRQALAKLDSLTQAVFIEMFGDPVGNERGWPERCLADVCAKIQIGPFGSLLHKSDYVQDGVPIVNPMHIVDGKIRSHNEQTVDAQKFLELERYALKENDVVMGRRGEMGRVAVVGKGEAGWVCGSGSLFLRPDPDRVIPPYVAAALSSPRGRRQLENAAQGVTMLNLNSGIVEQFSLGVPPVEEQEKFSFALAAHADLMGLMSINADELDTLFASLQQRAFRGEL